MFPRGLPFARSILCFGLVVSGIGLGNLPQAQATSSVRQLEKKINKMGKKTKKAVRRTGRIVLGGAAQVGLAILSALPDDSEEADSNCGCAGSKNHHKGGREDGSVVHERVQIAPSVAPPRSATHAAEAALPEHAVHKSTSTRH
jgi:hypothetical protein